MSPSELLMRMLAERRDVEGEGWVRLTMTLALRSRIRTHALVERDRTLRYRDAVLFDQRPTQRGSA